MKKRRSSKRKIGLALGSGAARGLSHIGVLEALAERPVPLDMIAGSSMGALVGAYYAKNLTLKGLKDLTLSLDLGNLIKLLDPNFLLFFKGVISGNKVERFLKIIFGDTDFKDLKIPLYVTATDVTSGEGIIINKGSVARAVRASISIPGFFTPVKKQNMFLIDGGIANPIPVSLLRQKGMDFIIASNVVKQYTIKKYRKHPSAIPAGDVSGTDPQTKEKISRLLRENNDIFERVSRLLTNMQNTARQYYQAVDRNTPSIFETVIAAIYSMEYQIARITLEDADLIISPEVDSIGSLEFYRAREAIAAGHKKAREVLEKIQP